MNTKKKTIGREVLVDIEGLVEGVPAKVDTGADASAIWASNIRVNENDELCFYLFGPESSLYTGEEIRTKDFTVASVKSASGHIVIKFCPTLTLKIKGVKVSARIGLCDRSKHRYPMLLGRRTISGRFLVDVSLEEGLSLSKNEQTLKLRSELKKNPYEFYKKYCKTKENN